MREMPEEKFDYWEFQDEVDVQLRNLQRQDARRYLAMHGDAIQTRITELFRLADSLYKHSFYGPALTFAVTAIDVIVQYVLVGAFSQLPSSLVDEEDFVKMAVRSSLLQRQHVPTLLQQQGISVDLLAVRLDSGDLLWDTIVERLWAKRNRVVHTGDSATEAESRLAVLCAKMLWNDVVIPLSTELGLTVKETHRWCHIEHAGQLPETFEKKDPF
jgi:hypothetical protein